MNSKATTSPFIVSLNSNKVLEYYRDRKLSNNQVKDLEKMDEKLAQGINTAGKFIAKPSSQDKAVFMANQLAMALNADNESAVAITCAYLATRYPDLKQLKLTTVNDQLSIELINDKEFTAQVPMKFTPKRDLI